jgi:hypothetical protein
VKPPIRFPQVTAAKGLAASMLIFVNIAFTDLNE